MNGVFVDSSVWIEHLRGVPTPGTRALRGLPEARSSRNPEVRILPPSSSVTSC